jgi:hypothetical protein
LRNVSLDAVLETLKGRAAWEIAEMKHLAALWTVVLFGSLAAAYGQTVGNIYQATLGESGQRTAEVSTERLRGILADRSAVVLDARPPGSTRSVTYQVP